MNDDVMGGMWKQIKGSVKSAFGALTDDDITEAEGNTDKMIGKLQERYGYTRADAERAWNDFTAGLNRQSDKAAADRHMDQAKDDAGDAIDEAKKGLRRALD
ncbi:MAG: CsbD family protein [Nitrososphaerales archaeon]